ncbi:carbohydrate-binding protein [Haloarcula salinisoli]|uniref:Carbohydrate-binding protein n=1 Tax=Haloarcula salinisoli TaxID=2487746 RepID=A0A8J7YB98_9EURY|nr:carbohydrate-binding protein [Halomicroarcula salinisoli]MBX0302765.1 carbohydrate-binding protein [Halomicroarcula salinisoli]
MFARRDFLRAAGAGVAIGSGLGVGAGLSTASVGFGDGVNLQPSYFCDGTQDLGWGLLADHPEIETVRIEIEPPSWGETSADLADARRWLDEAADNGLQVVATCHHYPNNGSNSKEDLLDAAQWWVDNYDYLAANSSFVVNLHNEWGNHETTREEFSGAYNEAVSTVRSGTDYTGPIVIDIPGWGQAYQVGADASASLDDDNLILSAHIYPSAWNDDQGRWVKTSDVEYMDENSDYPCIVGEFGSRRDGEADWSALVDRAASLGWPVLGWAWNGDGEDMNMTSPYWGDDCGSESYEKTDYFDVVYDKLGQGDPEQRPYEGPHAVPGRVAAEDFDIGGAGVAYSDGTEGTTGEPYRPEESVDLEAASENGYNICDVESGEWWEYTVEVAETGAYELRARVASEDEYDVVGFSVAVDGDRVASTSFDGTGGWQRYTTVSAGEIQLGAGECVLRIRAEEPYWNLNWFELEEAEPHPDADETVTVAPDGAREFSPATLQIEPGTVVAFEWDADGHTLSVDAQPDGAEWAGVDGTQSAGHSHTHTFDVAGTYEYSCRPHRSEMQGTVTVAPGDDDEAVSMATALDEDDDGEIDDAEILDAVDYWHDEAPVPGTDGRTIDDQTLLELVERWQNGGGT